MAEYRGRIAPSPTGLLHAGHGRTFWIAWRRAREAGGRLAYREEDLDRQRSKPEFAEAALQDLRELGLDWDEGPDTPGGEFAPYRQSERLDFYREAWRKLQAGGFIYPCKLSRKAIQAAMGAEREGPGAPHEDLNDNSREPIFPERLRPPRDAGRGAREPGGVNWRFRAESGETIRFHDGAAGPQEFETGKDFGDFLIWRRDGDVPAYELAVVADDAAMQITEVVRGRDLLLSTARQLLVYRALGLAPPAFYHCELVRDANGKRLAKRSDALALRTLLKEHGAEELRRLWF